MGELLWMVSDTTTKSVGYYCAFAVIMYLNLYLFTYAELECIYQVCTREWVWKNGNNLFYDDRFDGVLMTIFQSLRDEYENVKYEKRLSSQVITSSMTLRPHSNTIWFMEIASWGCDHDSSTAVINVTRPLLYCFVKGTLSKMALSIEPKIGFV